MIKKILIYTLVIVLSILELECHAQNATILLDSTYVRCTSISSMTSINYKRILVLNSAGSRYANFVCTTDNNRSLKSFKCTITPMNGKKRTLGKKDISSTELSENLADDYTTHYLEVTNSTYPYMVELEYQTDYSNGYISMPSFAPAYMHGANVQKAVYTYTIYYYNEMRQNVDSASLWIWEKNGAGGVLITNVNVLSS